MLLMDPRRSKLMLFYNLHVRVCVCVCVFMACSTPNVLDLSQVGRRLGTQCNRRRRLT